MNEEMKWMKTKTGKIAIGVCLVMMALLLLILVIVGIVNWNDWFFYQIILGEIGHQW